MESIINKINHLKRKKNALVIAHNYQLPEIQKVADIIGDSLALSREIANVGENIIIFCGVKFMAESAKILSPDKKILLPVKNALCPMADMIKAEKLKEYKRNNPDSKIVCYVNSSMEVKAESDICVTSSNAVKIVNSLDAKKILFVPDKNLGNYVKNQTNKEVITYNGYCPTHERVNKSHVKRMKNKHPLALLLVHPECDYDVLKEADFIGSTSQIINYANKSKNKKFIIGTEKGVLYKLKKDNPNKEFILLDNNLICEDMKKITLKDVLNALENEEYEIKVDNSISKKALKSLTNMLNKSL